MTLENGIPTEALANYILGWSSNTSESEILSLKMLKFSNYQILINHKIYWRINWINSQYKKMELIKLSKILQEYWPVRTKSPSQEWTFKLHFN